VADHVIVGVGVLSGRGTSPDPSSIHYLVYQVFPKNATVLADVTLQLKSDTWEPFVATKIQYLLSSR
jgi:hypothetical protein